MTRRPHILPGFGITMGFTLCYLGILLLLPIAGLLLYTATLSWEDFWKAISHRQVVASYKLSFGASFIAATLNVVFGGLVAWVLVRYEFPFKRLLDALVDLPYHQPHHPRGGGRPKSRVGCGGL